MEKVHKRGKKGGGEKRSNPIQLAVKKVAPKKETIPRVNRNKWDVFADHPIPPPSSLGNTWKRGGTKKTCTEYDVGNPKNARQKKRETLWCCNVERSAYYV